MRYHYLNGNLTDGITKSMEWNWDNKLRSATVGSDSISCKYAPDGSMVYKQSTIEGTDRKFIVDIVGRYPVILMELDPTNNNNIEKTYVHANGQVLMQHDGDTSANKFLYLHDRLGSVRQLIGTDGAVENHYTYNPFGQAFAGETDETIENRFRFAGYKWDPVTGMYNCNARWYDPAISRFTGRDPVKGKFKEPMTLHAYLYCRNNPINRIDPTGLWGVQFGGFNIGIGDPWLAFDEDSWDDVENGGKAFVDGFLPMGDIFIDDYADTNGNISPYYSCSRLGGAALREGILAWANLKVAQGLVKSFGVSWNSLSMVEKFVMQKFWQGAAISNVTSTGVSLTWGAATFSLNAMSTVDTIGEAGNAIDIFGD